MADVLVEIIGSLIILILGWLGFQVRAMAQRIDDLDEKKVDKVIYQELKQDLHRILEELIQLKLEQARWQGRMENQDKIRQERF